MWRRFEMPRFSGAPSTCARWSIKNKKDMTHLYPNKVAHTLYNHWRCNRIYKLECSSRAWQADLTPSVRLAVEIKNKKDMTRHIATACGPRDCTT
jgi:hypothetical protein